MGFVVKLANLIKKRGELDQLDVPEELGNPEWQEFLADEIETQNKLQQKTLGD